MLSVSFNITQPHVFAGYFLHTTLTKERMGIILCSINAWIMSSPGRIKFGIVGGRTTEFSL